jgi:REP element-mobilizing transposase RayT
MIHGYHAIIGAYGFWLPNDPRGSWSDFVGKWEFVRFGRSTKSLSRFELTPIEEQERLEAKQALKYPPVSFTGIQARGIGRGFGALCAKRNYTVWACAILPEHTHLVIARHTYSVESIVHQLKGQATRKLVEESLHPLAKYPRINGRPPKMWARGLWKVYLENEEEIENAIHYVVDNPLKERKPQQNWSFVSPFRGLGPGWVTHH